MSETSGKESHPSSHPIFNTDPTEQMKYVYKEICVRTEDGNSHTGHCYTVDPVSQSFVLVKFGESGQMEKLRIVMGHCIQQVSILDKDTEKYKPVLDGLFRSSNLVGTDFTAAELEEKKEHLRLWLSKNRIPVKVCENDSDVLNISDALFIEPPYGSENCRSTNEIVLGRVQGLIKSMPCDQSEW